MTRAIERLCAVLSVAVLVMIVSQGLPDASLLVAVAITSIAMIAVVRVATRVARTPEVRVGGRSRAHRESLAEFAAPRHPSTPGRRRSRAPSESFAA